MGTINQNLRKNKEISTICGNFHGKFFRNESLFLRNIFTKLCSGKDGTPLLAFLNTKQLRNSNLFVNLPIILYLRFGIFSYKRIEQTNRLQNKAV